MFEPKLMKTSLRLFLCSTGFLFCLGTRAQDVHFSQFYMAPLNQNPAMAGALFDLEALANYKSQWSSITTPYKTVAVSYDMRLGKNKSKRGFWAGGLNFYSDRAGDANMGITQANLTVAYHIHLNEYNTLGGGLQGGYAQRSISTSGLQWGNQYNGNNFDASLPSGETIPPSAFSYADAAAGIVWTYNNTSGAKSVTDNHDLKFNLGASVFHPQEPSYSFYNSSEKLYMKFVVHGSGLISIPGKNIAIVPGFMYYRQGPTQEIYAGSMIRYKLKQDSKYTGFQQGAALSLGAYYRAQDAIAATILMEYSNYAIGFSYDINTSPLKAATNAQGGYEISIRFVNPNPFTGKSGSQSMF
jgi:type IX secretion system PorP/SprF family membrane protein